MKKTKLINYDKLGIALSTICVLHCLVFPVIVALIPFVTFLAFFENPYVEFILIWLAILNAGFSVTIGYKKHSNFIVPAVFLSAIIIFGVNIFAHDLVHKYKFILPFGSVLAIFAHYYNRKLCSSCEKCKTDE